MASKWLCVIAVATSLFSFKASLNARQAARDVRPPNVLILAIDDLNDWLSCLEGHPDAKTPHIDALAARGTLFRNAHCAAPICGPSRAALWSGLRPSTTGIYGQVRDRDLRRAPRLKKQPFLPEHFAAHGYSIHGVGKLFHGGRGPEGVFPQFGGRFGGSGPKPKQRFQYDPAWFEKAGNTQTDWGAYPQNDAQMPDWKTASWASEILRSEHESPFLLAVGFVRPHVPFYVPPSWFDALPREELRLPAYRADDLADVPEMALRVSEVPMMPTTEWALAEDCWRDIVQAYLACVHFVDAQVGRVLQALETGPNAGHTVIVLWSDHGYHLGEKNRFSKHSLWERSTRVPLIIAGPGWNEQQLVDAPVSLLDLYPTLNEMLALPSLTTDGHSLVPLLRDPAAEWPHAAVTTYGRGAHSVRDRDHRLTLYPDGSAELYDHRSDPNEWHNLADRSEYAAVVERLRRHLPTVNAPEASGSSHNVNAWHRGDRSPQLAQGFKVGEVTQSSALVWTRTTRWPERLLDGPEFPRARTPKEQSDLPRTLSEMRHAVPGVAGELRLAYRLRSSDTNNVGVWQELPAVETHAERDYTHVFRLNDLQPGCEYELVLRAGPKDAPTAVTKGAFATAPRANEARSVKFVVATCQDFPRRDHVDSGHRIYHSMRKLKPDFFVHLGDIVYYDKAGPFATNRALARFKWHRMYALPFQRNFHLSVPSYFCKDDHDLLKNDCWPGQSYFDLNFSLGLKLLQEQLPVPRSTETPYRTIRWGQDLQIWLLEGREFRSPNSEPDGPQKTILGPDQRAWLERTLTKSDARYKVVLSATPFVGPDRDGKRDNHANMAFSHEGGQLRALFARERAVVINGDRHWQYASIDPLTGLREFGCGPASDAHAGGYPKQRRFEPEYVRIGGGFLSVELRSDERDETSLTLRHHDVEGDLVHESGPY